MRRKVPGILPTFKWLHENGYSALEDAIHRHPTAFAHIQQSSKRAKSLEEHIKDAARLAKQFGQIPCYKWLCAHGHEALHMAMRHYPDAFTHLSQARQVQRPYTEYVRLAEKWIKNHGSLPTQTWLRRHGHEGLEKAIKYHPEAFAHLKQKHGRK